MKVFMWTSSEFTGAVQGASPQGHIGLAYYGCGLHCGGFIEDTDFNFIEVNMLKHSFLLFMLAAGSSPAVVIFSTDFHELPPGWLNTGYNCEGWEFSSDGALAAGSTNDDDWSAVMKSPQWTTPGLYFVPDGADSITVDIQHTISIGGDPTAWAKVFLTSTTMPDISIYTAWLSGSGFFNDDEPIHYALESVPPGTWLGMHFEAYLGTSYGMYNGLSWHVTSLTITVHGDELGLQPGTWGSIKSALFL